MNLAGNSSQGIADAQLASFIEQENQKQHFQSIVHTLTDKCWDLCSLNISSRLDGKSERCLTDCIERFLDTSNYIINKISQEGTATSTTMNANEFSSSTDFSLGAPDIGLHTPEFSTDDYNPSFSSNQQEKKSHSKFW
ncbi:unnamed protein product [Rotaria sp. Silwood2]|nr:unnamed protein product [Rotaria sp. Silwood2]CAF2956004.1 unnamed protein product [Rotaria sp. Silwood2]CAF3088962.1 unnamed protein product [Rotaria sp. Silwood2]CAF3206816.1 unnamed protein product [Rotaria sp. Silwood2]CAF3991291.1 unnamed protein product [Rotaria sp. Silwood2]